MGLGVVPLESSFKRENFTDLNVWGKRPFRLKGIWGGEKFEALRERLKGANIYILCGGPLNNITRGGFARFLRLQEAIKKGAFKKDGGRALEE